MQLRHVIPALLACLLPAMSAHALAGMSCDVQFLTNAKWSAPSTLTVQFMTGAELNKASGTAHFLAFKSFAVIPTGVTDKAIIELDVPKFRGGKVFSNADLKDLFAMNHLLTGWQVNGKAMVKWTIEPQRAAKRYSR
jgi:hypothetical protein